MSRLTSKTSGQPLLRLFRRARRDSTGATAVEFALVAAPFFFLLFAMIEIAAVFFTSTVLENAVLETAREIRTGQAQAAGMTREGFQDEVCARIEVVGDCDRLEFDVRVFQGFDTVDQGSPVLPDGTLDNASFGWDPGEAGDIVLVRVFYRWSLLTPNFGGALSNMGGNQRLLSAASVFRNEPFDD